MFSQLHAPLVQALHNCGLRQDHAAFYAPGHKRGQGVSSLHRRVFGDDIFRVDVPELPELDDLFAPESVILAAQQLAAEAFGAEQTWFLVNGSTCGVEAALLATCGPGDQVLVPRNAHQSVLSGLILSGAMPVWMAPVYDPDWQLALGMTASAIAATLRQHPAAKAVVVVSPTYEGVCSDIAAIAEVVHGYDLPLIVDAAHGPHFAFHDQLPPSALSGGADIVIHSAHKVLAAFTQAALIHVQGSRCDRTRLGMALRMTQSSSPSYLLLGSLDAARHQMVNEGEKLMEHTLALAHSARCQLRDSGLSVLDVSEDGFGLHGARFQQDYTRLTVDVSALGITGFAADAWLHGWGVTAELPTLDQLTFIVSLGNSVQDIERLVQGLRHLVNQLGQLPARGAVVDHGDWSQVDVGLPGAGMSPREAFFASTATCAVEDAIGRLSADVVCIYPPGIPQLMPGEPITQRVIHTLKMAQAAGAHLSGLADPTLQTLRILQPG
ncbi:aminotransferase class I/II-fold pyridoxal phosphate-dependent enzyme [Leptothoe sp. PORK10 BA2]|uniref:aminotransferase class I/II-fold pyridoxal phosphate-dependent enzyme n=1 Tax=Leptothoe sp. PORK10 BA2 TaxID=3110254 RepID=UPI002B21BAA6|nr:aminotransferase class I/II-fold pyridoxal phosphate-dependent enzyme [Leptothoe sp. PORK10 BA2]MEA5463864.1 aminotransferase class I/II-fold pyridoxal phosphate-dependent enzyme [Leptothoe sp. PORK10 BA2]